LHWTYDLKGCIVYQVYASDWIADSLKKYR